MPAKKQMTREHIIETAYQIVREGGMDALNARTLAKRCGCSTQPLYLSFSGIDEIKGEVTKRCLSAYDGFIRGVMACGKYPEYKSIGMGYIGFARQEKEIFKYLFMRNRAGKDGLGEDSFDKDAMAIMKNYGLYKDEAVRLHAEMWVFVHGIATMCATGYLDWEQETVSAMLTDVYQGLLHRVKGERS